MSPCASRSAIQVASLTSLLRPGTFLMCAALASTSSNSPSSRCHTGFQYTPVASIAMCVQPASRSQSASDNNPRVTPYLPSYCGAFHHPPACHHLLFVHVQPRTSFMHHIHSSHLLVAHRRR